MATAQPLKADAELSDQLNAFARSVTHTDVYDKVEFRRLEIAIEKQQKRSVVDASMNFAFLYNTVGNFGETERWIRNAEHNNAKDLARLMRVLTLVNHGFATQAIELAEEAFAHRVSESFMSIAERFAATGAFKAIVKAVQKSQERSEVLVITGLLEKAVQAAKVYDALGVDDKDVAAMVDVAGELMRDSKLIWQFTQPDISVVEADHGGPSVSIEFRIDVSPGDAVNMGWKLTERIVERGLDRNGILVDFLGTRLDRQLAA